MFIFIFRRIIHDAIYRQIFQRLQQVERRKIRQMIPRQIQRLQFSQWLQDIEW